MEKTPKTFDVERAKKTQINFMINQGIHKNLAKTLDWYDDGSINEDQRDELNEFNMLLKDTITDFAGGQGL